MFYTTLPKIRSTPLVFKTQRLFPAQTAPVSLKNLVTSDVLDESVMLLSMLSPRVGGAEEGGEGYPQEFDSERLPLSRDFKTILYSGECCNT